MPKPTPWQKDFRRLKKLAMELAKQADFFERNIAAGSDDTIRSILVRGRTDEIAKIGKRLSRRWYRTKAKLWQKE